jgi:hypothetical protein
LNRFRRLVFAFGISCCAHGFAPQWIAEAAAQSPATATMHLSGSGLNDRIPGCDDAPKADFIDRMQRNFRRVQPEDCQTTRLAPPLFAWTEPRDAPTADASAFLRDTTQPFEITVRRDNAVVARQKTLRPAAAFTSRDATWSAGDYSWSIAFVGKSGARMESAPRCFRILPGATALDWPDGKTLAARVAARPFPRPLPEGQTFASVKQAIDAGDYQKPWLDFERLTRSYLSIAAFPLPREPTQTDRMVYGSLESVAAGLALQVPIEIEERIIRSLAYAYRFTAEDAFKAAAIARLRNLAAWSLAGASAKNGDFDISNRAIYRAIAEGLDLLWSELSAAERAAWVKVVRARMQPVLKTFEGFDTQPYDSHLVGETAVALETLLHVAGMPGFPEAQAYLAETWERYRFGFNVWGGEDGGWSNGIAYGWYSLVLTSTANAALRVVANVDMARHPYVRRLGHFHMAFVAPATDGLFLPFGDGAETSTFFSWYVPDSYRLHSALVRDPEQEWYWRAHPATVHLRGNGKLSPWHFMLAGMARATEPPRQPEMRAWVSADAGVGALFSKISDPRRSALYMRASRYGSVSHSHADQNAIAFDSRGQNMLISSGYYPYYGSPHHMGVARLTGYKNALTFDGGIGQNETVENPAIAPTAPGLTNYSMDNRGELLNFHDGPRWGVLTGDASNAYRPRQRAYPYTYGAPMVDSAFRSAAYDRIRRVAVIYDYAHSPVARTWELNFHALSPFRSVGATQRIDRRGVSLCIDIHGPGGAFHASQGFAVNPEKPYPSAAYPEQYHARFTAAHASTELTSITILREDCNDAPVKVVLDGARARVSVDGATALVFERKQAWIPQ